MQTDQASAALFESDEILWFDNGRWGKAGYAMPNPAGKTWTNNAVIFQIHSILGRSIFDLMHRRDDVAFNRGPHEQFWFDLHQTIIVARKRLNDEAIASNDPTRFIPKHSSPVPRAWLVYPVPFFGERIRQPDVRHYCELALMLLSEIMQHSDNEHDAYFTTEFAAEVGVFMREILAKMSMKYFGKTRAEVYVPNFALTDADFKAYDPGAVLLNVEQSNERPPLQWWPTENDLSQIRGIPINDALTFAKRWPASPWFDRGDGGALPDQGPGTIADPGQASGGAAVTGGFVPQSGLAP